MAVRVLVFEHEAGTDWLVGTDLALMRCRLQDMGGAEIDEVDLEDVLDAQFEGVALLCTP